MSISESYPHWIINVEDQSRRPVAISDFLPLHRPVFVIRAEKGPINVPVWIDTVNLFRATFGEQTLNTRSKYFSSAALHVNECLKRCGCYVVRVADETAEIATMLLSVEVTEQAVPQYQRDVRGAFIKDENGDLVPVTDANGAPVSEPGISIKWVQDTIPRGTVVKNLRPETVGNTTKYPMIAATAKDPGAYGNEFGMSLSYDVDTNEMSKVDRIGSVLYTFAPVNKALGSFSNTAIKDKYNRDFIEFASAAEAVDPSNTIDYSAETVLKQVYDRMNPLPVDIHVFCENFELVGEAAMAVENTVATVIKTPNQANVVSCLDIDGNPYSHVIIDSSTGSVPMKKALYNYAEGGADGNLGNAVNEELVRKFFAAELNPDITDEARYPFTFVYDPGYSLQTKYALIDFMGIREDVMVVVGTQDLSGISVDSNNVATDGHPVTLNTKFEDEAIAASLHSRAILQRESIVKGTNTFRCTIMFQAGPTAEFPHVTASATLWLLEKNCECLNTDVIAGKPVGVSSLINSTNTLFESLNWLPNSPASKKLSWFAGGNYCEVYEQPGDKLKYPALQTVYDYKTSVLSGYPFAVAVVLAKHECRRNWSEFSGMDLAPSALHVLIRDDLTKRLRKMLNGKYTATVEVFQTADESALGYAHTAQVTLRSGNQNLVTTFDIIVDRLEG